MIFITEAYSLDIALRIIETLESAGGEYDSKVKKATQIAIEYIKVHFILSKIYRMFSFISQNWKGKSLTDY